ncbi:putative bifunctional diguanylate cyclase/phosphodiesterase [Paenibacillus rigui]|nr:EAL domain-containing protein [Paenibacillus rigui]
MTLRTKIIAMFTFVVALLLSLNNVLLYSFTPTSSGAGVPYGWTLLLLIPTLLLGYWFVEYLLRPVRSLLNQYDEEINHKNKQIDYYANHDFLTGLPNRILFKEQCRDALQRAKPSNQPAAILFLDLDRFKIVNDMFGHSTGDDLLRAVSKRLQQHTRFGDTVSRIEGDEFALLLDNADGDEAARVAQLLLDELSKPFVLEGNEFYVTPSIGISLFPNDALDEETLVKHADTAMYQAKELGRNHFRFYTKDMNEQMAKRARLEKGLRKALDRDELTVHYQPQIDLSTGEITGMEALLRWHHPELGVVSPADFVPLAEENGMIIPIGEWVLRRACVQNKAWLDAGLPPMRMAVNLSARQFQQNNLVEVVKQVLKDTDLPPSYLDLEITESVAMFNESYVIAKLHDLKNLGIKISIDDFGTGYSSLSYLKKFPIDALKIDRSFVAEVMNDTDDAEIIATIISMARNLKVSVIAEGVENEDQLTYLRNQKCTEAQGYLFSKPMDALELQSLLVRI